MTSGNGRPFDLSLASNRFVLAFTPAAGIVAGVVALIDGRSAVDAIGIGISAGGGAFLAWAISRELHPDRAFSAGVAAILGPFGLLFATPDLLLSAVVLLTVRPIAGTTGRRLSWVDVLVIAILAAAAIGNGPTPGVLLASVLGVLVVLDRTDAPVLSLAAVLAVTAVVSWAASEISPRWGWSVAASVGVALGLLALTGPRRVEVSADDGATTIRPRRVWAARGVALIAATAAAISAHPGALAPVWSALVVVGLRPT